MDGPARAVTTPRRFALTLSLAISAVCIFATSYGCRRGSSDRRELTIALAVFPAEAARYQEFVRDFESRQHVRIGFVAQSYSDILRALRAEAGAGRGRLDLVELDLSMLGEAHGSVRPLDGLVGSGARSLFPKAAWAAATIDRHVFFIPHRLMWQAMIYNRLQVPHPPATWSDLRDFARRNPGRLGLKAARYEGLICDVMPFVWSAGGSELNPLSRGSLRAIDFIAALSPSLDPESAVFREMSILEAQARGEVWIHFNWPFAMSYLAAKQLAPAVNLSAPIPAGPDGSATPLGGGYLAVPRSAPHPELAYAFLRYLMSPEVQLRLGRTMGWYGSVAPQAGSQEARLYAGFIAMQPHVRARRAICDYTNLSNLWQQTVRGVMFDQQPPRGALNMLAARFATTQKHAVAGDCGDSR
jgi:ABC-type glycerol-3-phosphate transport system substrate-binding protein